MQCFAIVLTLIGAKNFLPGRKEAAGMVVAWWLLLIFLAAGVFIHRNYSSYCWCCYAVVVVVVGRCLFVLFLVGFVVVIPNE
mmetsp:Transcript_64298/g.71876  ORF Transcript_64298/g.71876 Transcript_64298/m.71876 type:complete len:82 (+) Transcript_64298:309-554(+)